MSARRGVVSAKHAEHLARVKAVSHAHVRAQKAARAAQRSAGSWWLCQPEEFAAKAAEQWPRMAVQQVSLPPRMLEE